MAHIHTLLGTSRQGNLAEQCVTPVLVHFIERAPQFVSIKVLRLYPRAKQQFHG